MAEITYDSILSSKPYCFLVGPREREFFIHASLAANKSSVLDSIVSNGGTKHEANGTAVWRHVEEDTFVRFGQYVYTGDYEGSAPSHSAAAAAAAEAPTPPVEEEPEPEPEPEPDPELQPEHVPDSVTVEKSVDSPATELATHVDLEAAVEPVLDEAAVPEKDMWGFFDSKGKTGGDYDWGFSATKASRPSEEEHDVPAAVPEPVQWLEEVADVSPTKPTKKVKKGKKTKRVLIDSEPAPAEAVVESMFEEEPAKATLMTSDFWGLPSTVPHPEPEPAYYEPAPVTEAPEPAEEDPWGVPVSKKKKNKKRAAIALDPEPEPAEAAIELVEEKQAEPTEPPAPPPPTPPTLKDVWHSFTTELRYDPGTGGTDGPFDAAGNAADADLEYAGVFLSHARVHALADEFRVEPLAQLALHKLHRILCAFTLHEARIGDVVALLRYSYEEERRQRRRRSGERLRVLVSKFAACHLKTLWTSEAFRALFAACGELAVAIMGHVIDKLV